MALPLAALAPAWAVGSQEEKQPRKIEVQQKEKPPSKLFRALGWASYGAFAGDAISTEIGLSRGAHEMNPLGRNRVVRISHHIALPILFNKLTDMDRKDGHEKRALWVRIAVVGVYGYVTAHNLRLGLR